MRWFSMDSQLNRRLPSTATRRRGVGGQRLIGVVVYQGSTAPSVRGSVPPCSTPDLGSRKMI